MGYQNKHNVKSILLFCSLFALIFCSVQFARAQPQGGVDDRAVPVQVSNKVKFTMFHFNKGVRLQNSGDTTGAIQHFDSSLSFDSTFVPSHISLQNILITLGKRDSIKAVYDSLKQNNTGKALYVYLAGRMLDEVDQEAEFKNVVELDSTFYWGYFGLGQSYITSGSYENAEQQLRKAVAINPLIPEGQLSLGIAYEKLGQWKKAVRQYEKVLIIDSKNIPEAYHRFGRLLMMSIFFMTIF